MTSETAPTGDPIPPIPPDARVVTDAKPVAVLVGELITDAQALLRGEIDLAKAELQSEVKKMALGVGLAVAGAFLGLFVLVFFFLMLGELFDWFFFERWLAYLLTTLLFVVTMAVLFLLAKSKISKANLKPERAQASVKENTAWLKSQFAKR